MKTNIKKGSKKLEWKSRMEKKEEEEEIKRKRKQKQIIM